jgi:pilus assembly protein Flp/PilA
MNTLRSSAREFLRNLFHGEEGQDLIEYALIAGVIALGTIVAMTNLGTQLKTAFNTVGNVLINAT